MLCTIIQLNIVNEGEIKMRLWHENLIPNLPRQQLLGQHRECCALRGNGWGRNHSTVNYVFKYSPSRLVAYHNKVMEEMTNRGYIVNSNWFNPWYRGKNIGFDNNIDLNLKGLEKNIYPEHDDNYYNECIVNLEQKGINIS